jgi:hypothetical protein
MQPRWAHERRIFPRHVIQNDTNEPRNRTAGEAEKWRVTKSPPNGFSAERPFNGFVQATL